MERIYLSEIEGSLVMCLDTGLDSNSFAKTKMSQSLIEPGYIVNPDGSYEEWKSTGVNEINGSMKIWGAPFAGKRLDLLINEADSPEGQTAALQAVVYWTRAKMLLGEINSTFNPGAAFICLNNEGKHQKGSVFFAPVNLSNRCLFMEGAKIDRFNCPDLKGTDAAAFCAGAILYKILSKTLPFPQDKTIFQDMREGYFLPLHLAVPELDKELCKLVNASFMLPVANKSTNKKGTDIISDLLNLLLDKENNIVSVSSLFNDIPKEEYARLEKEKKKHLLKQDTFFKTKRFAVNNKYVLMGAAAGLLIAVFIIGGAINNSKSRPTTQGMDSETVINVYYDAFSSLDHMLMEACVQGASKTDINAAAALFAVYKTRQAYDTADGSSLLVTAKEWQASGGELPYQDVFGVTDLSILYLSGSYEENVLRYRVNYFLWSPDAEYSVYRTDTLTLKLDRKKNWRITEILRDERQI